MPWEAGRQGTGYEKLTLFRVGDRLDAYLIHYPEGSHIPPHIDPVPGRKHFRLNLELWRARRGGEFVGRTVARLGRLMLIRPDRDEHEVTKIESGKRIVFSAGWTIKRKKENDG